MHHKNLQILIIVIVLVIIASYFWQRKVEDSDLEFQSLDNVSEELRGLLSNPLFDDFEKFSSTSRAKKSEELSEHTSELFFRKASRKFLKRAKYGVWR